MTLDTINSATLNLVLTFCEYHKYTHPPEITRPLQYNDLKKCTFDVWDSDFISSVDFDKVTDILNASTYLDIRSLTDLCYARLALFFRGRVN
jgi:hypothetical protein